MYICIYICIYVTKYYHYTYIYMYIYMYIYIYIMYTWMKFCRHATRRFSQEDLDVGMGHRELFAFVGHPPI